MLINNFTNYSNSQNFTGNVVDTYALRKFKAGLSSVEMDTFEKYIADIEKVNDGKNFLFAPVLTGNSKFSKIHRVDKDGKAIFPPVLFENKGNSLDLFKRLSELYKSAKV